MSKNRKLALNSGIQTNQILTNDDEVCIPSLSSILLDVLTIIAAARDVGTFKWCIASEHKNSLIDDLKTARPSPNRE